MFDIIVTEQGTVSVLMRRSMDEQDLDQQQTVFIGSVVTQGKIILLKLEQYIMHTVYIFKLCIYAYFFKMHCEKFVHLLPGIIFFKWQPQTEKFFTENFQSGTYTQNATLQIQTQPILLA